MNFQFPISNLETGFELFIQTIQKISVLRNDPSLLIRLINFETQQQYVGNSLSHDPQSKRNLYHIPKDGKGIFYPDSSYRTAFYFVIDLIGFSKASKRISISRLLELGADINSIGGIHLFEF